MRKILFLALAAFACSKPSAQPAGAHELTLGAYSTPREAYGALIPAFKKQWAQAHPPLEIRDSYLGSGAQARAIVSGFEADLAALSLEPDIAKIEKAGLIHHDWKAGPFGGVVTRSIVVIGVRPGNPKGIHDWSDLAKPGLEVLTPNVRMSGGAMWNVLALAGPALTGSSPDPDAAVRQVAAVLRNVKIMDPGARESMLTFERGRADAIITYENEMLVGKQKGAAYEYVIPPTTVQIENPVALVDSYVEKHHTREAAEAFLAYLSSPEAQRIYAANGLRPVLPQVEAETSAKFPKVQHLLTIKDFGGWEKVEKTLFAKGGIYDRALAAAQAAGAP